MEKGRTDHPLVFGFRLLKTYDGGSLTAQCNLQGILCRRTRTQSVLCRNFGPDLEVVFRKHSCYVRDTDGVELIKGFQEQIMVMASSFKPLELRIFYQKIVLRTPQQNDIVERRNRTLIEADRIMLIFSKAPMFLWAEDVATACYTQNRSLIHTFHNKTSYELVHDKKPDLTFFRVFGALWYPTNDSEDLGKLQPMVDIGIFVSYAPSRKGYRIYNKRTRRIMETIHVQFDELTEHMAPMQLSTGSAPSFLTPGQIIVFQSLQPVHLHLLPLIKMHLLQVIHRHLRHYNLQVYIKALQLNLLSWKKNHFSPVDNDPFINVFALEPSFEASSSGDLSSAESPYVTQTLQHLGKWSKDHPLDNIIGNPSRPVSTRKQLATNALWCLYNSILSKVEPKNFKSVITEDCWFQAMQDEIHEFDRL
ncbi:retrovirus-related pol polyprotein from transposon TNT 1-94 [Tanacetum coccineum]